MVDAYLGTLTEREFKMVLNRDGVIGGSSASIQGSLLVRGDEKDSSVLIGDHQHGFGFISNCAIDQEVIVGKRQNGLSKILADSETRIDKEIDRKALLGIGIDADTAIVVNGSELEVIGKSNREY